MKKIVLFTWLLTLLIPTVCFAENAALPYRIADAGEAAEMLLANDDYYDNLGQQDLNYRLQKTDATHEELKEYAALQALDFSEEEKALVEEVMADIGKICEERGYQLPQEDGIIFAKTTMEEECGAGAYTHGTQIYLGKRLLEHCLSASSKETLTGVISHELFHCLTCNNPDFQKAMYGILGFTIAEEDYVFPQEVKEMMITNPDVEHHNTSASFRINGEKKECTVIFKTTKPFEKEGEMFFDYGMIGLIPTDDLSAVYSVEEAEDFWEVFGRNSYNVIDPEETMADNFSYTMVYGTDGRKFASQEIIEQIDACLRGEN